MGECVRECEEDILFEGVEYGILSGVDNGRCFCVRGGCNVSISPTDVSPTENSWMLHPLNKVSLGYFAPERTISSL
jgi:hypothetical protein